MHYFKHLKFPLTNYIHQLIVVIVTPRDCFSLRHESLLSIPEYMERGLQPKIRDCGSWSTAHAGGAVRAADARGPAVPEGEGISTLQTPALGQCDGAEWCGQVSTWVKDESNYL